MNEPEFLDWAIMMALHRKSLDRFGGLDGIRDRGALASALAAAENSHFYGDGDVHAIAAAYAFHLAESQGFLDGNKRTAMACAATFPLRNGCVDQAEDQFLYAAMIAIAKREMDKAELAAVLRRQFPRE